MQVRCGALAQHAQVPRLEPQYYRTNKKLYYSKGLNLDFMCTYYSNIYLLLKSSGKSTEALNGGNTEGYFHSNIT